MKSITTLILIGCGWSLLAQNPTPDHLPYEAGDRQSPININTKTCENGQHDFELHYEQSHEHVKHGEHTVRLDYDPGSYIYFDGVEYTFQQFHFHTPSEHLIDNQHYPLEMHMVHSREGDSAEYLVISILFKEGNLDTFLGHFLDNVPSELKEADYPDLFININEELLPNDLGSYYYYKGSLTTPPYTETVTWVVVARPHEASSDQIKLLYELEGQNCRETQAMSHRKVQKCTSVTGTF